MVLSTTLHIDGHKTAKEGIRLKYCNFYFSQAMDSKGLPNSIVHGGVINLSFVSIDDTEIIQWMISADAAKNGKITFVGDNNTKAFKVLEFRDARLVAYSENFTDESQLITSLTISARELTLSGVTHANPWLRND